MAPRGFDRREFVKGAAGLAAGAAVSGSPGVSHARMCPKPPPVFNLNARAPSAADLTGGKRPNILFVMTDQERYYGNLPPGLNRPNLDRLMANSVSFDNAFCAYPLCSPSRAAMFTGLFPHQSGVTHNMIFPVGEKPLPADRPHLGSVMASAGYRIGYHGKWDLSKGPTYYMANLSDRGRAGHYGFEGHCGDVPDQEYGYKADQQAVDAACRWIREARRDEPWFAVCSIIDPHDICHPRLKPDDSIRPDVKLPASLHDTLETKPADQRETRDSKLSHLNAILRPWVKAYHEYEDRDWKLFLSFYYDLIEGTDRFLGQLFGALEDADALDDTIIVYVSDHGEMGGAHGFHGKYEVYEEAIHVPLCVYHPSLEGDRVGALTGNCSIAPTIASLAGVDWPAPLAGPDLSPWLLDPRRPGADAVFSESETVVNAGVYKREMATRMVRTDKWKYSYSFFDVQDGQLYDLENDPVEMNNLFHDPAHRGIGKELEQRLRAWQAETGDYHELPA